MKTLLLFVFLLVQLVLPAQTPRIYYLKAADKLEYQNYLKWCNDSITIKTVQWGKATIKNTNTLGVDYEMLKAYAGVDYNRVNYGDLKNYVSIEKSANEFGHLLKDTLWYKAWKPGTKTPDLVFNSNQRPIIRFVSTKVPRRLASIPDFYANWKTGLIQK